MTKETGLVMNTRKSVLMLLTAMVAFLLTCCTQRSEKEIIVFTNVNLIPMTGEKVAEDQAVVIEGSKIVAIGNSNTMQIPKDAQLIDGKGAFLMPGLADMHMHTREDWEDQDIWPVHPLNLYLANGVTTIRDFAPQGSPLTYPLQWRDEISAGTRIGPTIYASGKLLYASPLGDPEGIVQQNYDLGFDFLKLYSYLSKDDYHRAMQAAKTLGMYTAGHIPYAVGLDGVLAEGMDEIAHVEELLFEFFDFDRDKQLTPEEWIPHIVESVLRQLDMSSSTLQEDFKRKNIEALALIADQLRSANIPVCTTMVVDGVIQLKLFQSDAFLARPENRFFESGYLASFRRGEEKHQVQCRGVEEICAFKYVIDRWILKGLHAAGTLLLLGTDSGTGGMGIIPGYSIHDELHLLVENGFTPYEALATGTVNAGIVIERMTGEGSFGTIEIGKRADLILIADNPLRDISTLRTPLGVMAAGRWYAGDTLAEWIDPARFSGFSGE
jgi:imidazolonepropionase-like amidohydrolase